MPTHAMFAFPLSDQTHARALVLSNGLSGGIGMVTSVDTIL